MTVRAVIREADCIGCTKCIQACPVDAILGSRKLMHTVIADDCIGCKLCVSPCPVDCIDLVESEPLEKRADYFKNRYRARAKRLQENSTEQTDPIAIDKKAYILDAISRAKTKRINK